MKIKSTIILTLLLALVLNSCKEKQKENPMAKTSTPIATDSEEQLYRPNFHFTPKEKWTNDPNGMFYHNGYYHLFYQHYPEESTWGPMHWGHAVSTDMLQWRHLPIALYPDELGHIWSGSAVVDHENTSGFGVPSSTKPIVAMYTNAKENPETKKWFQTQSIAFSLDEGTTWTKYEGNPNIKNPDILDFRDPKMIWDTDRQRWLMVLAAGDKIMFYTSKNLKDWEFLSDFGYKLDRTTGTHGGVWECPDFFPLKVEGSEITKWILYVSINPGGPNGGSATEYFIGDFDGKNFTLDEGYKKTLQADQFHPYWIDFGRDNYAGVSWSDVPASDGRRIYLGWMSNWEYARDVPTTSWRNGMTIPREVRLINSNGIYRLGFTPIEELNGHRGKKYEKDNITIKGETKLLDAREIDFTRAEINFDISDVLSGFAFKLANAKGEELLFGYDADNNTYYVDRSKSGVVDFSQEFVKVAKAPRTSGKSNFSGKIVLDKTSVELFLDKGETTITEIFFPTAPYEVLSIGSQDQEFKIKQLDIHELNFN